MPRKHIVNESFYDTWSHEMAYIMGYFIADGNVSKNGCTLTFTLHEKDLGFLKYVVDSMDSTYPIRHRRQYISLVMNSSKLVKALANYRIFPNKRETWTGINFYIPTKFRPDLVRGFFDGDGWVCRGGKQKQYINTGFANKSHRFLEQIRQIAGLPTTGSLRNRGSHYQLEFGQKASFILRDFMYNGGFSLKRKRDKLYA